MNIDELKLVEFKTIEEFEHVVKEAHKNGNFKGDTHSMNKNFHLSKDNIDYVALGLYDGNKIAGFACYDILKTSSGEVKAEIKNIGVCLGYRRRGLAKFLTKEGERLSKERHPELSTIFTICNPVSGDVFEKCGHTITNYGRITSTGKRCLLRTEKKL